MLAKTEIADYDRYFCFLASGELMYKLRLYFARRVKKW